MAARRPRRKTTRPRKRGQKRKPRRSAARRRSGRSRLAVALVVCAVGVGALVPSVRDGAQRAAAVVTDVVERTRAAEERNARVAAYASRYRIPLDLAEDIERAAVAERIDPDLAFRLVQVESSFRERAVSPAGALGLTQLMPETANWLQPGITREQIFERQTNLRLGFGYLRRLLRAYDGDVDRALHAYNRGPGTVDRILAEGGDPANGYAERILRPPDGGAYRGSGFLPAASAGRP